MEGGSLLPEALRYMQQIRQNEQQLHTSSSSAFHEMGESANTLILSLYCIDSDFEQFYCDNYSDIDKTTNSESMKRKKQKQLHQKLGLIHSLIHSKLLPCYQERYDHPWFTGGKGPHFGLHCSYSHDDTSSCSPYITKTKEEAMPHLRAVIKYGVHPTDEYYAIAIMLHLSHDLFHHYKIKNATSCWDADDGQILLIEGAEILPSWVDDVVGSRGMSNRVYIVNGQIRLLDPSIRGRDSDKNLYNHEDNIYHLSIKESLFHLLTTMANNEYKATQDEIALNQTIQKRFKPFIEILDKTSLNNLQKRQILSEYIHTAVIVLPLQIALAIIERPDIIPCAILQFCSMAPMKFDQKEQKKKRAGKSITDQKEIDSTWKIKFEHLVFTTFTTTKSLYAMLLTAAGQIPPPIKIPKQYKSIELNKMRRQCLLGGEGYSHFRHSIEVGIRLTLGFEWILNPEGNGATSDPENRAESKTQSVKESLCDRISHHRRIDTEMGGDGGNWIQEAWEAGPNSVTSDNDISTLIKCPVFNPEILRGGICPLSHPGKTVSAHFKSALSKVQKQDLSSSELSRSFPFPTVKDVDSDAWIDLNSLDDLEDKMSEVTTGLSTQTNKNKKQDGELQELDHMMTGLESFVQEKSDIEGIATKTKPILNNPLFDPKKISPKVFLSMLHDVLKAESPNDIRIVMSDFSSTTRVSKDKELLKFFSQEDLDFDNKNDEMDEDIDDNNEQKEDTKVSFTDIMKAMDEELDGEELDRTFKVPDVKIDGDNVLPFNDPTAIQSNVLSNLLESLDAQDGSPGPVSTILKEMGIKAPGDIDTTK